nr:MAG TPA_asm: hypothetical protein [Caudoviricetes sp.]
MHPLSRKECDERDFTRRIPGVHKGGDRHEGRTT